MSKLGDLVDLEHYITCAYYKAYALNKRGGLKKPMVLDLLRLSNVMSELVREAMLDRGLDPDPNSDDCA